MKQPATFREFLDVLRANGQLLDIREPVNMEPDLAAAAQAGFNISDQSPALLFHNLNGYTDAAKVALNMVSSWPNMALSFGMDKNSSQLAMYLELLRRWRKGPMKCALADAPPFLECVHEGEGLNIFDIMPVFRLNMRDGGPFISKGCIVTRNLRDPQNTDKQNVSIMRVQIKNKNFLGIQMVPGHDGTNHLRIAEEMGKNLPIAIAVGVDPALVQAAGASLAYGKSEYEYAGAILEQPYKLYHSKQSGLDLPWGAEYIIEGEVLAGVREPEGPFGEFTGYYSGVNKMATIKITRIMHRKDAIFENLLLSRPWNEEDWITAFNNGVIFQQELETTFTGIRAVNAMHACGMTVIISCKPSRGGVAKAIGMRVMTTAHGLVCTKSVILVDEDVDPFNNNDVWWALSTNMNPKNDVVVIPNLSGLALDPGSEPAGITHKLIIDATRPVPPETHGRYGRPILYPDTTSDWEKRLRAMIGKA
jgi:UbiD family decarboxylase